MSFVPKICCKYLSILLKRFVNRNCVVYNLHLVRLRHSTAIYATEIKLCLCYTNISLQILLILLFHTLAHNVFCPSQVSDATTSLLQRPIPGSFIIHYAVFPYECNLAQQPALYTNVIWKHVLNGILIIISERESDLLNFYYEGCTCDHS